MALRHFFLFTLTICAFSLFSVAQADLSSRDDLLPPKKEAAKSGQKTTGQAWKESGHAMSGAAHQTGEAFKDTWHNTAATTQNAWDKTADTGKDVGSSVADASKDIWHSIKNLFS